ncbi:IS30 family transposase [Virgibacillus oceani]
MGYAKRHKKFDYVPSTKTLYNWIDEGKLSVINMDLELKLRRSTKKVKSRKNKKVLGSSIEERPESIDTRDEFGCWEIDTVLGHKSKDDVLLTLVERKTRMELIKRIPSKSAPAVTKALEDVISAFPNKQDVFRSITSVSELADQGTEKQIDGCFAHPYASMGDRVK